MLLVGKKIKDLSISLANNVGRDMHNYTKRDLLKRRLRYINASNSFHNASSLTYIVRATYNCEDVFTLGYKWVEWDF